MNSMNIPGASKGKPDQGDDKTNKDKHEDNHGDKDKEQKKMIKLNDVKKLCETFAF